MTSSGTSKKLTHEGKREGNQGLSMGLMNNQFVRRFIGGKRVTSGDLQDHSRPVQKRRRVRGGEGEDSGMVGLIERGLVDGVAQECLPGIRFGQNRQHFIGNCACFSKPCGGLMDASGFGERASGHTGEN